MLGSPAQERIGTPDEIGPALDAAGIRRGRPVVALVGGAGGLEDRDGPGAEAVLHRVVLPVLASVGGAVVDGGTDAGVMRLAGRARQRIRCDGVALVGVAAAGTVRAPDAPEDGDTSVLEPHHDLVLLVPGDEWGDETPWLAVTAGILAAPGPVVTVLVNGGSIAYADARAALARNRSLLVLAGTGRAADEIAAARAGRPADTDAVYVAASPQTTVADVADPVRVAAILEGELR